VQRADMHGPADPTNPMELHMNLQKLTLAAVLAVSFTAFGQAAKPAEPAKADAAKPAGPPAAPMLPAEGKKWVESHLGNWKSNDVALTMGEKSFKGKMSMKCDKASGGWGAICTGKMDMGKEMPAQEVTFLYGWNIGEGVATMFEVSNMAEVHQHTGKWADEKSITVTHNGKNVEGKDEKDALTFTWNSPREMTLKGEGTSGGQTLWTFTATAKK
jgi:hypothetical protein